MKFKRIVPTIIVAAWLAPFLAAPVSEQETVIGAATAIDPELVLCDLQSEKSVYSPGEHPKVWVRIFNTADEVVYLPGSLDGSEDRRRFPHVYFEMSGPFDNAPALPEGGCGNLNYLRASDFVRIEPGEFLDPYSRATAGNFFPSVLLRVTKLENPGDYHVTFHYSTTQPKIDDWLGDAPQPSEEIKRIVPQVPLVDVSCSTTLTVRGR